MQFGIKNGLTMDKLTLNGKRMTKIGKSAGFLIPKAYFTDGLLDDKKTYKLTIEEVKEGSSNEDSSSTKQ